MTVFDKLFELKHESPTCSECKHLLDSLARRCRAFDDEKGIPVKIWQGRISHTEPYPGDNGYHFEPKETEPAVPSS